MANKTSTLGIIIRDSEGLVMASSCCPHTFVHGPEMIEAKTYEQILLFGHDLGFHKVIAEGDTQIIINKASSAAIDRSEISALIFNIKRLCQCFECLSFNSIPRSSNSVAHLLARATRNLDSCGIWI
ncbi:hypothetical protein HRI_000437100 [Hibiscus trionum]|uniref:RNase H type-1 domain-containing protein n=1 Tax=Hibiscus trionum TaxID=183268 RepID=A0A9W7GYU7_HIBTR|nr:hypothetical protein HRI_000437100 [Hibiscus trionum]